MKYFYLILKKVILQCLTKDPVQPVINDRSASLSSYYHHEDSTSHDEFVVKKVISS